MELKVGRVFFSHNLLDHENLPDVNERFSSVWGPIFLLFLELKILYLPGGMSSATHL